MGTYRIATALHYAAMIDDVDKVELLWERGARANVLNSTGQTPCKVARLRGSVAARSLLRY